MITEPELADGNVAASGRNVTLIVHVAPTEIADGQSFVAMKLPLVVILAISRSAVPLLVSTTV
jgi:hypothetical protein